MKFSNVMLVWGITISAIMGQSDMDFNNYFEDKTLRIDYYHVGDSKEEFITIDKLYKYGIWAGSRKNLIDNFDNGRYYHKIYDASSGKLLYSKGFDSYFSEYKSSEEGLNGIKRTYHESALIPAPKNKVKFALELRNDKDKKLNEIYSYEIDPASMYIIKEEPADNAIKVYEIVKSGDPHAKVDIVILSEGYTAQEQAKFESDLKKFADTHFNMEPYKTYKSSFNIYGVFKPSMESGADEPSHASFKNTVLSATFSSLGSERYLLTEDNKTMRDMAAHVPYDAIYIMVNHKRYGGGGIYNLFCTFTADNQWQDYLFLHEFGHSFAGLADEYYTSDITYNEFYPQGIEPNEPNITALLDPQNIKWKDQLTDGIEIPTPWEKEEFDKMDYAFQEWRRMQNAKIAQLKVSGAPEEEIKKEEDLYNVKDREHTEKMDKYLAASKYAGKVGAMEGAGYAARGLYRSMADCIMFSKGNKPFCKVCEQAIINVIKHYEE